MTWQGFPRTLLLIGKCSFPSHQCLCHFVKKSARRDLDIIWAATECAPVQGQSELCSENGSTEREVGGGKDVFDSVMHRVFWILSIVHPSQACSKSVSVSFGKEKKPSSDLWLRVTMWGISEPQTGLTYSEVPKAQNFASVNFDYFNFVFLSPVTSLSSAQLSCGSHMSTGQQASCLIVTVKTKQSSPYWSS